MSKKNNGATFNSFEEFVSFYQTKPHKKDEAKLAEQREKFLSKHLCRACKQPMTYITGTNMCVCKNPQCKGIKFTREDPDTHEKKVFYETSFSTLDDTGVEIAEKLFD